MSNVLKFERRESSWDRKYGTMSMTGLLEEMVRYNEEKIRQSSLSMDMIVRGIALFSNIEKQCTTSELRLLSSSYRRHLEHERTNQIAKNSSRS